MSGSETIRNALIAGSPLPTSAADRVRFNAADQSDEGDYIVIHRVGVQREYGLDNTLLAKKETFQVLCWSDTPAGAHDLEDQAVAALALAFIVPLDNEPDGLEPIVDENCAVLVVDVWTTPQID